MRAEIEPGEQRKIAGIGSDAIEKRIARQRDHERIARIDGAVQPFEHRVEIIEAECNHRERERWDIPRRRFRLELVEQ